MRFLALLSSYMMAHLSAAPGGYLVLADSDLLAYTAEDSLPPDGAPHDIEGRMNGSSVIHNLNNIIGGSALERGCIIGCGDCTVANHQISHTVPGYHTVSTTCSTTHHFPLHLVDAYLFQLVLFSSAERAYAATRSLASAKSSLRILSRCLIRSRAYF